MLLSAHRLHNHRCAVIGVISARLLARLDLSQLLMIILAAEREQLHLQVHQVAAQLTGVCITVLTALCQRLVHNLLHAVGNLFHKVLQLRHRLLHVHHRYRNRRRAHIGNLTGQHLEEHNAQRIHVAACRNLAAAGLLRRNIMHRTHNRLGINHRLVRHHLGDTKIGNLRIHVLVDKNILRLDVAVNNVMAMRMLQSICQTHAYFQHGVQAQLMLLHIFLQRHAVHIFHNYILIVALGNNIVNVDDIRMHQTRRRLGLTSELLEQLLILEELVAQHLHRHISV